ncbi:putative DNA-binding domain protein [[Clostridium] bifermentans ATCC 638]|uniref:Putative DNA-binding domain protein n=1 Tax=Paraclostridium bifermentans ATCC 638 = DSM 14991 TaxID=1233171 RepID=T4V998_PARBF|nr:DNA-binding domain protein [Paraclostridium bifermentans]EQK40289.1 putative DNA-binding domain protein [[Clostridium] bifermentans ATCC 638] [Paraclostridium bifermentans ATCC 638 = DSM 14991]RIZ57686.1 hypothetical protein CHH45_15235 [Paraclostridium bifermentans]UAG19998.1 hypothetical protein KXZ80_17380 [Paraclostridium bifermentans]
MISLSNKKQVEKLQFEKTRLEIKVVKLEDEVLKLKSEVKKQEDLINEWRRYYKESVQEISKLKNQLKEFNPNLKPRSKKISQNDIDKIKELFNMKKYTYREISNISNWSICTISKVINGYYD